MSLLFDLEPTLTSNRGCTRSVRRDAVEGAPLSIGHNPTHPENKEVTEAVPPPVPMFKVWKKGARVDFAGIRNEGPNSHQRPPSNVARGEILSFSNASRLNLMRMLATIQIAPVSFTMALTLPGTFEHLSRAWVKRCFLRLNDQFVAKAGRDSAFGEVGYIWKQELQKRGALHFHLLVYGTDDANAKMVQSWISKVWNSLICSHSATATGDAEKHLWWHNRPENFTAVKNMHGYFAKYLGKDEKNLVAEEAIPGRWWGICNKAAVPFAQCADLKLPVRVAVLMQRVARKIRQKRADNAKHRAIMRKIGMIDSDGAPRLTQLALLKARHAKHVRFSEDAEHLTASQFEVFHAMVAKRLAADFKDADGEAKPMRFGRFKFNGRMKFSGVVLVGETAPRLGLSILKYAGERYREILQNEPF